MNRLSGRVATVVLFAVACAERPTPEPTPPETASAVASASGEVPPAERPPAEPTVDAPPTPAAAEPAPPEAPPPLVAPDGTQILPCGTPPEGMACIPGGPFIRGSDDGPANTRPAETVWLQTFYMDVHEVTYGEYKDCQNRKECPRAGPLYNDFGAPRQPITGVKWTDAVKFCEVHGKHLPTEAQWEKAARGPDGALHPWGDEPATCERAVIMDEKGRSCGIKKRKEHPDKGKVLEVGSRPAGVYGLHDMSGNAWEWVYDWADKSWAACGDDCRGTDPKGPCEGKDPCRGHKDKVVRGGSWYWDKTYATSIYRRLHVPHNDPFHHFGFRCAASIDEAKALSGTPAEPAPAPAG
jgi:sulfatase modifying factor 1